MKQRFPHLFEGGASSAISNGHFRDRFYGPRTYRRSAEARRCRGGRRGRIVIRTGPEFCASQRSTGDYRELLADKSIDAIHICTPNELHFPMAKDALEAGKHVLCEKPLALALTQAEQLTALAKDKRLANCTFFNVRAYPQAQTMRWMIERGDLGEILIVQGTYLQDWLFHPTDWNWRIESGPSRTFADIGSHWCDLA